MNASSICAQIIELCQSPDSALHAIHLLLCHGQVSPSALMALYQRVITDSDVDGAYYLASLAQKNDDLPFDALPLIELVLDKGNHITKLALLDKLPKTAIGLLAQSRDLSFYQPSTQLLLVTF